MNFSILRKKMVEEQLMPRGIKDPRVIEAFQKVPRHRFIPEKYVDDAYKDFPLPIGAEQTISQPYMVALMTQCLGLSGGETVLEIGTGSGYQAAILAEIAAKVYSVERVASLAKVAKKVLKDLGYGNVQIKVADGTIGWQDCAPYDGIIVTAAAPAVPEPLIEQLNIEAKLVVPIGARFSQILTVVKKYRDNTEINKICGCVFVPLIGKYAWREENA